MLVPAVEQASRASPKSFPHIAHCDSKPTLGIALAVRPKRASAERESRVLVSFRYAAVRAVGTRLQLQSVVSKASIRPHDRRCGRFGCDLPAVQDTATTIAGTPRGRDVLRPRKRNPAADRSRHCVSTEHGASRWYKPDSIGNTAPMLKKEERDLPFALRRHNLVGLDIQPGWSQRRVDPAVQRPPGAWQVVGASLQPRARGHTRSEGTALRGRISTSVICRRRCAWRRRSRLASPPRRRFL